jgi:hypothetical protein
VIAILGAMTLVLAACGSTDEASGGLSRKELKRINAKADAYARRVGGGVGGNCLTIHGDLLREPACIYTAAYLGCHDAQTGLQLYPRFVSWKILWDEEARLMAIYRRARRDCREDR